MNSNRRIVKNTLFLYARMLVVMGVTFFTSRIVLEVLGVSDYGVYNVVGGIVTMMAFLNGALSSSTSRFLTYELGSGNQEKLSKTFSASLTLHIGVAFLVLVIGETLGLWFFYEKLVIPPDRINAAFWIYQFSIITTMVNFTQVPYNASIIAHENMSIYAYVGLYEAISKLLITYFLYVSPIDKLIFYSLLLMLNTIGIQLFYRYYTKRYKECRFTITKDKILYKSLLSYSGWDLFGGIAVVSQGQGINILLNLFFGPTTNAARAIAVQIQTAISMFVNNFMTAVRPQVVKNYACHNYSEMYKLTFQTAKFSYLLMLIMVIPICFEMKFILHLWLGENVPNQTYLFAIIIVLTCHMETFHSASLMSYHAIGKIKTGNIIGGSLMISAMPISYIFLKIGYPAYSVFIIIFIVNFIIMILAWWIIHKYIYFPLKILIKDVYQPCCIISILAYLPSYVINHYMAEGWGRLITLSIFSIIIIPLFVYYIGLSSKEKIIIKTFIKAKL